MLDFLDKLRTKPLHVRKQIAIITTACISLAVVAMWWGGHNTSVPQTLSGKAALERSPTDVVANAFSGIKNESVSQWQLLSDQVNNMAAVSEGVEELTEEEVTPTFIESEIE